MSKWMKHVKAVRDRMPKGTLLKDILKEAAKTYKKGKQVVGTVSKGVVSGVKKTVKRVRKSLSRKGGAKKSRKSSKTAKRGRKGAKKSRKSAKKSHKSRK